MRVLPLLPMIPRLLPVHTSSPLILPSGGLALRGTLRPGPGSPTPDGASGHCKPEIGSQFPAGLTRVSIALSGRLRWTPLDYSNSTAQEYRSFWCRLSKMYGVSDYTADVVGLQYDNRSARLPEVNVGDAVTLIRDYGNPYDVSAVTVTHRSGELGHLPRYVARLIAPQMDTGFTFRATITGIERGAGARVQVSIALQNI